MTATDDLRTAALSALDAYAASAAVDAAAAAVDAARAPLLSQIEELQAQVAALEAENRPPLLLGARVADIPWSQAVQEIGPPKVTRLFHHALPAKYSREGYPPGVRLIVSFKDPGMNVRAYAASIPAGEDVELCFHHEAENDYGSGGGAAFLADFAAARAEVKAGNPDVPVVKIAGGYQYGAPKRHGWDGSYLPPDADRYYMDSYQRGPTFTPAQRDTSVQRYLTLLAALGKPFNGFTEYGRGVVPFGGTLDPTTAIARRALFPIDATYLRSLPDVRVWCYWYTLDGANPKNPTPDQWRLTDPASQAAWRAVAQA